MPKFQRRERVENSENRSGAMPVSKEELDAKHAAALSAKSIISWKSPDRIFIPRSKKYFTKVAMYSLALILLAIAFEQYLLVGVILALAFVVYVFATIEPLTIEHRITNLGIVSGGRAFLWEELVSFWFDKKGEERLLFVQTNLKFPTSLIIILSQTVSERTLLDLLEKHLHFHHGPVHTLFDKWASSLQKRINLE